ncbi:hypothetical protein CCY99_01500 [Helicobacter sp. 16-1353]|uniref:non-canonical purine NTP pyrophosphatase n=1 Tax=Helicobacter sp. 16-1353 TaxID=2004996 RepID=UPI000DCBC574|nr:non-canonical purine NTP pyrophosphatase [Helicobacter sp. 16-1353]RAX54855.1 hypothetical protein CCY99_01500 [Helicobacter sp. 16-1353]
MKIILFSQNKHKVKEIESIFSPSKEHYVRVYTEFIEPFCVVENGESFKDNAILKLRFLSQKLPKSLSKDFILMSEDSGICVQSLDNQPGIYSSRYANIDDFSDKESILKAKDSSDEANINKLINSLKNKGLESSKATFISCVAVLKNEQILTTHGFLNGKVVTNKSGESGFGYDPIFIPNGYSESLAVLGDVVKDTISHRFKALKLMKILLK